MAKAAKSTKKRPSTAKKSTKKTLPPANRARNSKGLIFVVIFAVIGAALLVRGFTQSNYPTDAESIVAGFVQEKPSSLSQTDSVVTYESQSATYLVMGDGKIQCDDGNSTGTVTTGQLSKGELKQLHKEISDLDLSTVPNETAPEGETGHVNNFDGYLFSSQGKTRGYAVYAGAQKPDKLTKLQDKIVKPCDKATTKSNRSNNTPVKVPKIEASDHSLTRRISSALNPKVSAAPSTSTATPDYTAAQDQVTRINYSRVAAGKRALIGSTCLNTMAYDWTRVMIRNGAISHSPDLVARFQNTCKRTDWQRLGENVGVGYKSPDLYNAFYNSAGHRANILGDYTHVGVGAYQANGRLWITQHYVKLP